jgi:hypothetical protein
MPAATISRMPAREETASPSTAAERRLLDSVVDALAEGREVVDAAALAGEPPDGAALVAALRERVGQGAVIACSGLLERLSDFVVVVEALVALASEREATVVLGVANEAFTGSSASDGGSVWGSGAVAELRQLLPADHVAFHQLALRGSALVPAGAGAELRVPVESDARTTVPIGFVLAFGPRADRLVPAGLVSAADLVAERAHERARTAELEVLRARVHALDPRPELMPANGGQPSESAG